MIKIILCCYTQPRTALFIRTKWAIHTFTFSKFYILSGICPSTLYITSKWSLHWGSTRPKMAKKHSWPLENALTVYNGQFQIVVFSQLNPFPSGSSGLAMTSCFVWNRNLLLLRPFHRNIIWEVSLDSCKRDKQQLRVTTRCHSTGLRRLQVNPWRKLTCKYHLAPEFKNKSHLFI